MLADPGRCYTPLQSQLEARQDSFRPYASGNHSKLDLQGRRTMPFRPYSPSLPRRPLLETPFVTSKSVCTSTFSRSLLQIVRTPQYFYKREETFRIKKLRISPDRP